MKIKFKFSIVLLALGLLFATCKEDDPIVDNPETPFEEETIQVSGNVHIPSDIPPENIGTMEIVSGFYSNPVTVAQQNAAPKLKSATVDSQYACQVTTYPNSVQLHTVFNNGNPFMFGLTIGIGTDTGAHLDFNEESTAISLIFMNPLFTVSDPATATVVVEKIKSTPSFNLLKAEIHNLMYQGSLNYMTANIEVENLRNYNRVIYETLLSVNENYQIQQNGLQVIENTRIGNEIQFKIRNYLKRYSTIYAYKYKDGQLTQTDIKLKNSNLGYGPFEWIDCGSYDWIQCWINIFTWNWEDQITQETDFFAVNVENAEKIYIKCYGLGIADGSFPAIDSEAYLGGALAMAKTAVFDIVKPTVDVITGTKDLWKAGDLRGRDYDDPVNKLIMNFYDKVFTTQSTYTKFLKAANNSLSSGNAKKEVFETFVSLTKSFATDEKNVELYIEILKKYATLSVAQKKMLNKSFSTVFQVKAWADLWETGLNLGEAVVATLITDWVTEFRINIDGTQETIPTDGLVAYYPFNGNANDESGNGNHGTVNGATLTADRKGNVNSAYYFDGIDDYIEIAHFTNMELLNDELTVCAWINIKDWYFSDMEWFPIVCSNMVYDPPVSFEINNGNIHFGCLNKNFSAYSDINLIQVSHLLNS